MTQPHYIDRACQKCGGEIQGWTCQGCRQVFRENDAGSLVFAPMEAVAWQWRYGDAEWMTRDNRPDWFDDEKANPRFYSRALTVIPIQGGEGRG